MTATFEQLPALPGLIAEPLQGMSAKLSLVTSEREKSSLLFPTWPLHTC
jgi:hypothetical protein